MAVPAGVAARQFAASAVGKASKGLESMRSGMSNPRSMGGIILLVVALALLAYFIYRQTKKDKYYTGVRQRLPDQVLNRIRNVRLG